MQDFFTSRVGFSFDEEVRWVEAQQSGIFSCCYFWLGSSEVVVTDSSWTDSESACLASQSDEKACVRPLVSNAIAVPVMKGQRPTGSKLWGSEYSVLMRIDGSVKETSD